MFSTCWRTPGGEADSAAQWEEGSFAGVSTGYRRGYNVITFGALVDPPADWAFSLRSHITLVPGRSREVDCTLMGLEQPWGRDYHLYRCHKGRIRPIKG